MIALKHKGRRCRLGACPPGLFLFVDTLVMKSEYKTRAGGEFGDGRYMSDAYIVASGEYFHGGTKSVEERERLMVQPVVPVIWAA